jgi:hypothetical protein
MTSTAHIILHVHESNRRAQQDCSPILRQECATRMIRANPNVTTFAVVAALGVASGVNLHFLRGRQFPRHGYPDFEYLAFFVLWFAQSRLLAVWLALGRQRFWIRGVLACLGVAALTLSLTTMQTLHRPWDTATLFSSVELFWTAAGITIELAMTSGLLCYLSLGNVILRRGKCADPVGELFRAAYSLRILLLAMTVVAVLLALGNDPHPYVLARPRLSKFIGTLTAGTESAVTVVVACWAAFGRKAVWAKVVFTPAIVALGTVVVNWYDIHNGPLWPDLLNELGAAIVLIGTLLVYRSLGYRWRPVPRIRATC